MTVRDVAAATGVCASTISRAERGSLPDIPSFARLCTWLNIPPDAFLDESGLKETKPTKAKVSSLVAGRRTTPRLQ